MANVDAFNSGFDAGAGKRSQRSQKSQKLHGKPVKEITTSDGQKITPFKKGGKVKKTGLALVHKGEEVLTAKQAKKHAKKTARKRVATKR